MQKIQTLSILIFIPIALSISCQDSENISVKTRANFASNAGDNSNDGSLHSPSETLAKLDESTFKVGAKRRLNSHQLWPAKKGV